MSNTNPNYGHSKILSNLIHAMNHSSSSAMTSSSGNNGGDADALQALAPIAGQQLPLLQGYLYKIHKRSGKKYKYFVIFDDAPDKPGTGRLEYFDNEKKFKTIMGKNKNSGSITNEKRSIILCTCFNINRRFDTKYRNVIGLYRKDDTFSIMAKDEAECNKWLKQLLILQRGKESVDQPRPTFEHVWEVDIIRRGLGDTYGIVGSYRVCITDTTLSLVRIGPPTTSSGANRPENVDFALAHMRACGSTQSFFYLEVGRFTSTGAGEIWMETYDPMIADNMNTVILNTAKKKVSAQGRTEENLAPMIRIRSQSATEHSKPMNHRRATLTGTKPNFSPSEMLADSTESSATSTGTIVLNQNALKPKNSQTHSVSQMSLQSTGISGCQLSAAAHKTPNTSKVLSSYSNKEQQSPSQQPQQQPHPQPHQLLQLPSNSPNSSSSCSNSISSSASISTINTTTKTTVISTSSPSSICHQRALSLPQNSNFNASIQQHHHQQQQQQQPPQQLQPSTSKGGKTFAIQPVHHRTRSLPLTEETAIDFSASSPPSNFGYQFSPPILPSNNSMESIIEDYQNMDFSNNNSNNHSPNVTSNGSYRGGSSILKHLSKMHANQANSSSSPTSATSPSQLRKKRQHIMTASLRSSSTRDRCDSFPMTRNRTTSDSTPTHSQMPPHNGNYANNNNNNNSMPPPKRPVSMNYGSQRYGNSPPNNSSPISPPSCSESDASSASIDETDGFIHSMTPEEHGNHHLRDYHRKKGSPTPQHEGYMDMQPYSPYSCSPGDPQHHAYMPMSPGGDHYRGGIYGNSSAHSRASSLAEDNDGYVPMHASSTSNHENYLQMSQHTEDYMNMQPGGDLSSATSSCSITSGTPSTDIRFSEYHLDKVQARFTPSEDDELLDRPARTLSVGSKLEHTKRKLHIDRVAAEHSSLRHRAYSCGSRTKVSRAELTSHSGSQTPSSHNSPIAMNHHHHLNKNQEINNNNSSTSSKNKKSSSAPLLANVLTGKTSQGSLDRMDDLMEIDFSSRSSDSSTTRGNTSSTPIKSSPMTIPSRPNGNADDYMNMSSGGGGRKSNASSPYVEMRPGSNRRISENNDNDYMDMNPPALRTNNTTSSLSCSPLKSAPRTVPVVVNANSNYMDMSPRSYENRSSRSSNNRMTSSASSLSSQKLPSDDYLNMSPVNKSLEEVGVTRSSVPDGYMEMSWNKNKKKAPSSSNDNPSSSSDEYINMDYSNNNNDGAGTSDSSSSGAKDRSISLPITINKRFSKTENCPPAFLPLNKTSANPSVSPTRPTILGSRVRCDSRDSGIVTPSGSQATIFPFSPGSPMKQFVDQPDDGVARKCLVDGSTGIMRLNEDDIIEEEPRTPVPMGMNVDNLSNDYAVMNLGEPVSKKPNLAATPVQNKSSSSSSANHHFLLSPDSESHHDYINCSPADASRIITPTPITPETVDYAIMNPVIKASSTANTTSSSGDVPPATSSKKSLFLTLSSQEKLNNSNACFKPIVEDRPQHPVLQRHTSEKGTNSRSSSDSGYEILVRPTLSRPNSVNSEKIKGTALLNRPSSANSERLALSSTSSSTSTLCELQSQTTTAVPSPMSIVTSRPESVSSDVHMTSRPPSVTSERELHYASLDLPACSVHNPLHIASQQQTPSSTTPHNKMDVDDGTGGKMDFSPQTASSSSSSASSQQSQQPAFTYAQIDFVKSECLKAQQSNNNNNNNSNVNANNNQSGSKK